MKHMQTPSQTFIAVRLETTGSVLRKPFEVVKKFNIVVTPNCYQPSYPVTKLPKRASSRERQGERDRETCISHLTRNFRKFSLFLRARAGS